MGRSCILAAAASLALLKYKKNDAFLYLLFMKKRKETVNYACKLSLVLAAGGCIQLSLLLECDCLDTGPCQCDDRCVSYVT